jgi:uncharacterized RDD family membrane protein YckC
MTVEAAPPSAKATGDVATSGVRPCAGLASRMLAFAADAAVINIVIWSVALVVGAGLSVLTVPESVERLLVAIGAVIAAIWSVVYFVFFWSASGQTPGNRLLRLRVEHKSTGEPIHAGRALVRVLALPLSALPLCAGFLLILFERRRRALHDLIAGTVVVYDDTPRAARWVPPGDG